MGVLSVALRKARSLTTFSLFEIALVVPVFVLLGLARLWILLLPFRVYSRWFGDKAALTKSPPAIDASGMKRAKRIGRVVRSVAKVTPWASLCLAQAMVATLLMRCAKLPYCVFFGVAPKMNTQNASPLDAHAWVMAGDTALTGGHGMARFTVVTVFEHRTRNTK